jgi:FkbM family methyltransferase
VNTPCPFPAEKVAEVEPRLGAKVALIRLAGLPPFGLVVGRGEASGEGVAHRADPVSRFYLDSPPDLHDPLVELALGLAGPGERVLDLGAHIGAFTLPLAAAGRRVVAIEASARNVALLSASIDLNGFAEGVSLVHAAAADRTGRGSFCEYGPWGCLATPAVDLPATPVRCVRIDDLLREQGGGRVGFVKIDIEGSEIKALWGMARLLRTQGPPLLCESNYHGLNFFGKGPPDLHRTLDRLGYRHRYLVRPGRLIPQGPDEFQGEVVCDYLAARAPVTPPPGWQVGQPASRLEVIGQVVTSCASSYPPDRFLLGRALRRAPLWLRTDPTLLALLDSLGKDPEAPVRDSVRWHPDWRCRLVLARRRMRSGLRRLRAWLRPAA